MAECRVVRSSQFNRLRRALLLAGTALVGAGMPAVAHAERLVLMAQAAAEQVVFSIPAQRLDTALTAFADQAGLRLMVRSADLAGLTAPALSGRYTPEEALARLLAGSGLTRRFIDDGSVTIERMPEQVESGPRRLDAVTVTAGRAERPLSNIPGSVSIISREEVARQTRVQRSIGGIIEQAVPGFVGANGTQQENTTIRGRGSLVLLNGVPQNQQLRSAGYDFRNIDPNMVERIEVVRGANATFGFGGSGGIINIITKTPEAGQPTFTTRVGTTFAPYKLEADSFTKEFYQDVSGRTGALDYFFGGSIRDLENAYDAEGDRIPDWNTEYNNTIYNLNGRLGWQLDEAQKLSLSANYFRDQENESTAPSGAIVGQRKADAVPTESLFPNWLPTGLFSDPQQSTNVNLGYDNTDVLGGDMRLEAFMQRWQLEYETFINAVPFGGAGNEPGKHEREERRLGFRANFDTPIDRLLPMEGARLVWGGDYLNYYSSELNVFDTRPVTTSFRPDIVQSSYAGFAQVEVPVGELLLSAGVRHERFDVSVESIIKSDGTPFRGGDLSYSATLANAGVVWLLNDRTEVYGGWSQGFDVTQVGRAAAQVNDVAAIELEPAITDQFEVGVRHDADAWQGSLSAFYTSSELGSRTTPSATGIARPLRQPEEIWGAEATLDVQPFEAWGFGGTAAYQEGLREVNGDTSRLQSWFITPLRFTGYAEYQPTHDWFNRLQFTLTPGHDRFPGSTAFGEGEVETVFLVDYIGEIAAGPGTVELGVRNLLNNQYVPAAMQALNDAWSYYAGQGTTVSLGYRLKW